MRLTAGLLAGRPLFAVLTGDTSLRSRPMERIINPLRVLGARIEGRASGTLAPLTISTSKLRGAELDITVASAQVKSAITLAALRAEGTTLIRHLLHHATTLNGCSSLKGQILRAWVIASKYIRPKNLVHWILKFQGICHLRHFG